jgi:hypothetical protein
VDRAWVFALLALIVLLVLALAILSGSPGHETRPERGTAYLDRGATPPTPPGPESHPPRRPPRRPRIENAKAFVEERQVSGVDEPILEAPALVPPRATADEALVDRTESREDPLGRYSARASRTRGQPLLV